MKYSFEFLRDYMSTKDIKVEKIRRGFYLMNYYHFYSVKELRKFIIKYYK
jgi:hypothetical protein